MIRNVKGEMIAARASKQNLCSPELIESEATLLALRTTQTIGISKLIVERHSMEVIKIFGRNHGGLS